ncbi:BON domain-containing protein [Thermodesulfobacteriota bacterium]
MARMSFISGTLNSLEAFQATPESKKVMDDLALAAEVKAALIEAKPDIEVSANNGVVHVRTEAPLAQESVLTRKIDKITKTFSGVKKIIIKVAPITPYDTPYSD